MGRYRGKRLSGVNEEPQEKEKWTLKRLWKEWGDVVIILIVVFLVLRFVLQLAFVPSGSMETTVPTNSLVIGWRLPYTFSDKLPGYGDIVTFWSDELDKVLLKRVIGLPGDTISFSGGFVYRNGQKLDETYLPMQGISESENTYTVPDGCFFVLGDNRTGSLDARYWTQPYIPADQIQAKGLLAISMGSNQSWQGFRWIAGR